MDGEGRYIVINVGTNSVGCSKIKNVSVVENSTPLKKKLGKLAD
jgi:hypothetical protein